MAEIQSRCNSKLEMDKVGCIVDSTAPFVGCLRGSSLTVDLDGVVKNIHVDSGFVFQVVLVGSIGVSSPCEFQLSCGT